MVGYSQLKRPHSSTRLFCTGVPVRTNRTRQRDDKIQCKRKRLTQSVQGTYATDFTEEVGIRILDPVPLVKNTIEPSSALEPTVFANIRLISCNA